MPEEQPSAAELLRRLEEIGRQAGALAGDVKEDRRAFDQRYMSRETYLANREADQRRFADIEGDLKTQADFRRQILAGLLLLFCSTVLAIVLALTGLK